MNTVLAAPTAVAPLGLSPLLTLVAAAGAILVVGYGIAYLSEKIREKIGKVF